MKNDNNNSKNIIIAILVVIIIILISLVVLLATETISFSNNVINSNEQISENNSSGDSINNSEKNDLDNNKILELNQNIYSDVLEEYKNAILYSNKDNSNYNYVNENAMNHYFNQKGTESELNFEYSFYDINKDGKYEMLVNAIIDIYSSDAIIDIFSYDGTKIIRLFKDKANCLSESRCSIVLYEDGTIYFRGSNGASHSTISFHSINKNISTLNTINLYYLSYEEDGGLTIYDGRTYDYINDTGTKLNYSSDKELLNVNIHNTNEVDLNKLSWTKIN